jgi:hypothetical protein
MKYPKDTLRRARRAIACSPFRSTLFATLQHQSIALAEIAANPKYVVRSISERSAERALLWLIQVGLLRREVDGQGLTDSFRLTPLGRLMTEQWQQQGDSFRRISAIARLREFWRRLRHGVVL